MVRRVLEPELNFEEAMTVISRWSSDCFKSHKCVYLLPNDSEPAASHLPTRVIDVGVDADNPTLRLVETSGQRGEYIALNHCWGAVRPLAMTKAIFHGPSKAYSLANYP